MRRCTIAALVLLASPDHLSHGASSSPPWQAFLLSSPGCRQTFGRSTTTVVERSNHRPRRGASAGFVGSRGSGGRRCRRKIGWSSRRVFSRRGPRLAARSEASNRQPNHPSSEVAVVLELQPREADTNKLAVYGELHRLLGTNRCRQLLGLEAVATLTSLNYLVLCHRDGGPSLYAQQDSDGGCGGARLALGDRSWDICGIGQGGPTMDSVVRRAGRQSTPPVADQHLLEREIESVVKIASRTEVFSAEPPPKAKPKNGESAGGDSLRNTAATARRKLQRLYARVRAARALASTPPPFPASSSSSSSSNTSSAPPVNNPLLRVGLGAAISRRDCNTILREADESDAWTPWDGDLGRGAVAAALESLPRSRALWGGKAGDAVRARIAALYGVPPSGVVADASGVFVCMVGGVHGAGGGDDARGETQRRERKDPSSTRVPQQQQQREQQQRSVTAAAGFRRAKSLVTFYVALSGGKEDAAQRSSWAVCLEERGECIRPGEPGSVVILSGKVRHASVPTTRAWAAAEGGVSAGGTEEDSALQSPPVVLLRGFASILHPSVLEESAGWQWGSPAWHVDAPWVKDRDILDRVWVAGGSNPVLEATGQKDPSHSPAVGDAAADGRGAGGPGSCYNNLERMNTTLAHRYYRQGLGGMGVPVVDPSGRPVVDVVEEESGGGLPLLSRSPDGSRSDKTGEVLLRAVLRRRYPWGRRRRRQVGKAGFSTKAGASPLMDATLRELFGGRSTSPPGLHAGGGNAVEEETGGESLVGVPVPPIKYVFVDPRYRGLGLGRRLFLEAMRSLARRGFRFALIVVEDNGSGGLFGFYEDMGFVKAEKQLGLPRAMIAPIPPPDGT